MKKLKLLKPLSQAHYLELVEEIGIDPRIEGAIHVRHLDGRIVTVMESEVFDIPVDLVQLVTKPLVEIMKNQEMICGAQAFETSTYQIAKQALNKLISE